MVKKRGSRSKDDPVLAEQRRLLEEQDRLLAKQERLKRIVEEAPQKIQETKRRERTIRIKLVAAPANPSALRVRDKFDAADSASTRRHRQLAREKSMAKFKFALLCAILAAILLSIWMSIPK